MNTNRHVTPPAIAPTRRNGGLCQPERLVGTGSGG
jgi:hypothetical protein